MLRTLAAVVAVVAAVGGCASSDATGGSGEGLGGGGGGTGSGTGTGTGTGTGSGTGTGAGNGGAKRVFVTSSTSGGSLEKAGGATSGPDGADALCRAAASAAGLGGSTWTAWVSVSGHGAIDRLTYGGPWVTVGGATAFPDKAALTKGPLVAVTTERGAPSANAAWTGTDPPGSASGYDCTYFTESTYQSRGMVGDPNAVGKTAWTALEVRRCDTTAAVMCFEQ